MFVDGLRGWLLSHGVSVIFFSGGFSQKLTLMLVILLLLGCFIFDAVDVVVSATMAVDGYIFDRRQKIMVYNMVRFFAFLKYFI